MAETPTRVRIRPTINRARVAKVIETDMAEAPHQAVIKAVEAFATRTAQDPFTGIYLDVGNIGGDFGVIPPPFPPAELVKLPPQNNTLLPCIASMVTNIEGYGYTLEFIGKSEHRESAEAKQEHRWITNLLSQPNPEESLVTLREKVRQDYETLGYAAIEVGRNAQGNVAFMHHVPANTLRITKSDKVATRIKVFMKRDTEEYEVVVMDRFFRRYVQMVGTQRIYFKEFGDPRVINPEDGEAKGVGNPTEGATEIIWLSLYVTGEAYGLPRWINQLPSIMGSRESEMTNLDFFRGNAIPAMAVLVSGGFLTEETVQAIENAFNKYKGRGSMNRVLVLEAQGSPDLAAVEGTTPVPKMEMKPMTQDRQGDALFQNYDTMNQAKIRSSFRLPPLFIGRSDDYTRATAEASLRIAEMQIFGPERNKIDEVFNTKILLRDGKPPKFFRFKSNPPKIVGDEVSVDAIEKFSTVGAMTPNTAIQLMNEMFNLKNPKIEEPWGDLPMELVKELLKTNAISIAGMGAVKPTDPPKPATPPVAKEDEFTEHGTRIRTRPPDVSSRALPLT